MSVKNNTIKHVHMYTIKTHYHQFHILYMQHFKNIVQYR